MTAADIQGTLTYLVPGFVALKVFYVLGLRTRRSDFEWTVLSIATAAVLNFVVRVYLGVTDTSYEVVDAIILGVVVAGVAAYVWRAVALPSWHRLFERQAWDAAFDGTAWANVWIKEGPVVLGWPKTISESAEADDQDILLTEPEWIDRETSEVHPMTGVRSVWIPASQIEFVQILDDTTSGS